MVKDKISLDDGADSLKELIRDDETYESIIRGKCSKCGEPYALITGSTKTCRKDGRRYAQINCNTIGWCAFRCHKCEEVIEDTWVSVETTSIAMLMKTKENTSWEEWYKALLSYADGLGKNWERSLVINCGEKCWREAYDCDKDVKAAFEDELTEQCR